MPQGVEHLLERVCAKGRWQVRIPLMPQGVEHQAIRSALSGRSSVRIPLMPQGVEHQLRCLLTQLLYL